MVNLIEGLLNFVFPARCPLCHAYVEEKGGWCPACLQQALNPHILPLSVPMQADLAAAWALGLYRHGLRDLIRQLKYQGKRSNLPYIENFLQAAGKETLVQGLLSGVDMAVPVPLYAHKEKKRGFNQAELIFGQFLTGQNIPLRRSLARTRATCPMYELSEQERRVNIKNAFAVIEAKALRGKRILLVDDILTTGATLAECASVLKTAGAQSVYALVLASDHR
ncbi:ComF family protein [Selenomonas sp.]|uniref:ComF family protein n=1 Tax=Selenomonas sp. TaxID=2053611 RepID=UPI0025DF06D3|nr:ComF family protein [Selenomonas sp.]